MKDGNYYLGLDVGSNSVGYAVTDDQYNLLKFHGESAWGAHVFDEGESKAARRVFRTSKRRLARRKQRVALVQELFAREIANVDQKFFQRLQVSDLYRDEAGDRFPLFNDPTYTDKHYHKQYPTIHHLIDDLMKDPSPHDVRLVYLACSWLVAHRGHFLSNIDKDNLSSVRDFNQVYQDFRNFFIDNGYLYPWDDADLNEVGEVLKKKIALQDKFKELAKALTGSEKVSKDITEDFPFNQTLVIKLLAGSTVKIKDLFGKDDYTELGSFSLSDDDEKLDEIAANIEDDFDLVAALRKVFDWAILADIMGEFTTISEAKIGVFNQHQKDLKLLKDIIKRNLRRKYNEVFREEQKANYSAYVRKTDGKKVKGASKEDFSKYLSEVLKLIDQNNMNEQDLKALQDIQDRLALRIFLPKQKDTNNRVVPQQLFWHELNLIVKNAEGYLPFLTERDENGLSVSDKIMSIFSFRIPYFVGPLNKNSEHAWIVRKADKIYPWNFNEVVDLDASEREFIRRMTNTCTYLPGEPVLPKNSLLYHKFMVLNEINNLRINGERISVELKQQIYHDLFLRFKKVTPKRLKEYLISRGLIEKGQEELISGIDEDIKSNLTPQIAFKRFMDTGVLSEDDVERIIERSTFSEDKTRLKHWIQKEFPHLSEADGKYICSIKIQDFGRLSRRFLNEFEGTDKSTGEVFTIISALWNTQKNLMELLSDKFTFAQEIESNKKSYYEEHPAKLEDRLDEMYLSPATRRAVFRTLDVVKDVTKAFGAPQKIFIEMTRAERKDLKGKKTKTRKQQLLDFYKKCEGEDVRLLQQQLEAMGEAADSRLQSEKLYLYYLQLGKSAYSGKSIALEKLGSKIYDIDHIYPQSFVKDDSVINNKVLVLSEENGLKSNTYPIDGQIRGKMTAFWGMLKNAGLMSTEKYKRLTRSTPFTDEERHHFINRQIVETSQSTKAVATLLKEYLPETEIVYSKAHLASEFRQEFDLPKSRLYNDLHHAVDAYLNIVVGNVYNMKFTKNFYLKSNYSIKTKTVFTRPVEADGKVIWDGDEMLAKVKSISEKNTAKFTKYSFMKKGGLFDQMPVSAAPGLIPRKKHLPTEKYGGYNKPSIMFFLPVKYRAGKKTDLYIMSVELLHGERFLKDRDFALEYTYDRLSRILNKKVDEVSFPLGMTPWKVNTVLSFDGFRVCLTGNANKGTRLIAQPIMQFSSDKFWKFYLKKLERLVQKVDENKNYVFDQEYDKVCLEKNIDLYDLYCEKLKNTIYEKRINNPLTILIEGKQKFLELHEVDQARVLLNIHQVFGRFSVGCDLSLIGGSKFSAATKLSCAVSNWKKSYSDVRVLNISPSGLWMKKSENILDLL
ncbi:MAG: type II CRISPR RNA-guided endonuclease Cas9 [Coriobacteriia bacterium]|nr:type II CRISPR RNA-guided endonuclease Cas9 [Coriobacteriia bacterium]